MSKSSATKLKIIQRKVKIGLQAFFPSSCFSHGTFATTKQLVFVLFLVVDFDISITSVKSKPKTNFLFFLQSKSSEELRQYPTLGKVKGVQQRLP